jgi:hypothetical protein
MVKSLSDLETLQRLGRARDFIDHCYDHPLSLDQISEKSASQAASARLLPRDAQTGILLILQIL